MLPILQRIGVSETSEQGLEELYLFMKAHPEVDTTPFITRLSKEFHAFVERGLQRLERRDRISGKSSFWLQSLPCSSLQLSSNPYLVFKPGFGASHALPSIQRLSQILRRLIFFLTAESKA